MTKETRNWPKQGQKDGVLDQVVIRLEQWAEWYSRLELDGLGYSSSSIACHWGQGGRLTRSTRLPRHTTHAAAEEMEQWVLEMGQQNPLMAQALRRHYFDPSTLRKQAEQLAISHTQFKFIVDMAHQWLAGRLSLSLSFLKDKN